MQKGPLSRRERPLLSLPACPKRLRRGSSGADLRIDRRLGGKKRCSAMSFSTASIEEWVERQVA